MNRSNIQPGEVAEIVSRPLMVATMHLVNAVTLPGFVGGQTTFSREKTPKIRMTDVGNGVHLEAEDAKLNLKSTALVPMSNIKILVYE